MKHYKYLIIGGGMTADAAVEGIREVDSSGSVALVTAEAHPPYNRPPLSKGLWKGYPLEKIWRNSAAKGAELILSRKVRALDANGKTAADESGETVGFDKLLIATGGTPRHLPFGDGHIIYFRTLDDYYALREMAQHVERFAVLGGGFIGSEIAAALAMNGRKVVMVIPEQGIGARLFPGDLSKFLNGFYRDKGVEVLTNTQAMGLEARSGALALRASDGRELLVDGVVAGIGITPNVELARAAGLEVADGIVVNELLQTSHTDIYAAGDVAAFLNPALGERIRVEHEDNANSMGRSAGHNMAGQPDPYTYLPLFYSDLFELGYEAVGQLDSRLEIVADWHEPYRQGVVYYLRAGRVRGALLWNVWDRADEARKLIAEPGPFAASDLKGAIAA